MIIKAEQNYIMIQISDLKIRILDTDSDIKMLEFGFQISDF